MSVEFGCICSIEDVARYVGCCDADWLSSKIESFLKDAPFDRSTLRVAAKGVEASEKVYDLNKKLVSKTFPVEVELSFSKSPKGFTYLVGYNTK